MSIYFAKMCFHTEIITFFDVVKYSSTDWWVAWIQHHRIQYHILKRLMWNFYLLVEVYNEYCFNSAPLLLVPNPKEAELLLVDIVCLFIAYAPRFNKSSSLGIGPNLAQISSMNRQTMSTRRSSASFGFGTSKRGAELKQYSLYTSTRR